VHTKFNLKHVLDRRAEDPDDEDPGPPRGAARVVAVADAVGSTETIIRTLREAPSGRTGRSAPSITSCSGLAHSMPDKKIVILSKEFCLCATMYRISPQNLAWALDSIVEGRPINVIRVPERRSGGRTSRSTACSRSTSGQGPSNGAKRLGGSMAYEILKDICEGESSCVDVCPVDCIKKGDGENTKGDRAGT
jgi:hypothetical protein